MLPRSAQLLVLSLTVAAATADAAEPHADVATFPAKPIRIIVGFTPGGGPDITARHIAQKLTETWRQQVIVDNRPGAGGTIAAATAATANPDGYTLLSVSSAHAVAPAIYAKLPYDPKDLVGISLTATSKYLLIVSPSSPVKSVKDLLALAKAKPGQLNFSSAGTGSGTHFAGEQLKAMAAIDVTHVPYKGIPEALTDAMTGRVQFFMAPIANAIGLVKDGKVRALGVSSKTRDPLLPDLPTVAEAGVAGYESILWFGLLAPSRTPAALVGQLNGAVRRILDEPETRTRWGSLGLTPHPTAPAEFDRIIAADTATFSKLSKGRTSKRSEDMKIRTNDIETNYMIEGEGPWLTMSHSLACNLSMWDEQAKLLSGKFKVLRYDTRGHGRSSAPPGPYSLEQLADDAKALFDALGITHTHWVGLSMGGMIGETFALKHPGFFQSMVLADTTSRRPPNAEQMWGERVKTAREKGMEGVREGTLQRWFTEPYRGEREDVMAKIGGDITSTPIEGFAGCCEAIARVDVLDRLKEIDCPTLVIVGDQDHGTPPEMARAIHENLRGSELVVIPSAAHLSNVEQPEAFNKAITEFLTRVSR